MVLKEESNLNLKTIARKIKMASIGLTVLAVLMQLTGLAIWPITHRSCLVHNHLTTFNDRPENDIDIPWSLPVGLFLTSFGWWECFVEEAGTWSRWASLHHVKAVGYQDQDDRWRRKVFYLPPHFTHQGLP